jgi:hypothetical protein
MQSIEFRWTASLGWQDFPAENFMPDLVLFFGSGQRFNDGHIYEELTQQFPKSIIMGCSGGGQISSQGIIDDGMTALALKFASTKVRLVSIPASCSEDSFAVGRGLGSQLSAPDLAGVFVLSEGLEINGDDLMGGLSSTLPAHVVVGGGMAADDDRFIKTMVSANCLPCTNLVAAVGFYGDKISIQSTSGGGWKKTGSPMKITASRNNNLYDLDEAAALEMYEKSLGNEARSLPMSGLKFPILVSDPDNSKIPLVRTLLGIDRDVGMLTFAGNVPEGWTAHVMHAEVRDLIDAASSAAIGTTSLETPAPDASILVSCIGRRLVLKEQSVSEVNAVNDAYHKNTALSGFYSYGEFSKKSGLKSGNLHNQSMTVFSMSEAV